MGGGGRGTAAAAAVIPVPAAAAAVRAVELAAVPVRAAVPELAVVAELAAEPVAALEAVLAAEPVAAQEAVLAAAVLAAVAADASRVRNDRQRADLSVRALLWWAADQSRCEPLALQRAADLVETAGSSIVAGMVHGSPSAIFLMVPRRILPERVFGRRLTVMASLNAATGPILSRTSCDAFLLDLGGRAVDAGLQHDEAARHLALQLVLDAEHRAFGDVLVRGQHLLHAAGRKPVAGDVDDVVGAAHHVDVAVLVDEAGVRGLVVAGELGEVALAACGRRPATASAGTTAAAAA